jgi:biopolymer transport protein TolR
MGLSVAGEGVKAEPNVVPMIDVMLVLLIIFMVVTPALAQGFKATPPDGINIKTHPEEDSDQVLGIAVDGTYWLNKRPIAEDTLDETIKRIYDARTVDKILYIKADKNLKFKFVAKAMDIAAKNGVR